MHLVAITFNKELSSKLYESYFIYERKKLFRQMPTLVMLAIAMGFMIIGLLAQMSFFVYMGVATIIIIVVAVLFYFIRFKSQFNRFLKEMEQSPMFTEKRLEFGFSHEKIIYRSEKFKNEFTWDLISYYEENDEEIYLFLKNHQLLDIISPKILGPDHFEKFCEILESKFPKA